MSEERSRPDDPQGRPAPTDQTESPTIQSPAELVSTSNPPTQSYIGDWECCFEIEPAMTIVSVLGQVLEYKPIVCGAGNDASAVVCRSRQHPRHARCPMCGILPPDDAEEG